MVWARLSGMVLIVVGGLTFPTIADDLRHVGELPGNGSVFFMGLVMLVPGFRNTISKRLALPWLAAAVGIGALVGAVLDDMPAGTGAGLAVGTIMAAGLGQRCQRVQGKP